MSSNNMGPNEGPFLNKCAWLIKCAEYVSKMHDFKRDGRFCDVDLVSGKTQVKAHRVVLAASCEYFDAMFRVGLEESTNSHVALPSVPSDVLPILIDFIYTGEVVIDTPTTAQQLLVAAHMMGLQELVTGCEKFLTKQLHPSNALQTLRFAETYNCSELVEEALRHTMENWDIVASGDEILELSLPKLVNLLSSNLLKVDSEAQVLYPALRWLEHDPESRRRHCPKVLSHIRLPLIAPEILDEAIKNLQDSHIALALETLVMKPGGGALATLAAQPRAGTPRALLLAGGFGGARGQTLSSVVKFDFQKREWEQCAPMASTRCALAVASLGGRVYAVGGRERGGQALASGEIYDPQAHRVVLAASCEYFDAMFRVGLEESKNSHVALPSVPSDVLPILIDFIYTGEVVINTPTIAQQLLEAAHMMGLQELVTGCEKFLTKQLHPSNALQILRFAETYICSELVEEALRHTMENWDVVASGDEILELSLPKLVNLLSSNQLNVDSEAQVLYPALRWLEHDPESRRQYCPEVLSHIRLPLIAPEILDEAIKNLQDTSIAVVLKSLGMVMKPGGGALATLAAQPRAGTPRALLLAGGFGGARGQTYSSVVKFDFQKREWEQCAPMASTRCALGVASLGGRVYAVGGWGEHDGGGQALASGEMYDPQTDKWSKIAPMKERRCDFGLTECNGRLYALGGRSLSNKSASVEVYDPRTDEWTLVGNMPEPRVDMGVVQFRGRIYIIGGRTQNASWSYDLLRYDPELKEWTTLTRMRHGRQLPAVVEMDGYLYVIGGDGSNGSALNTVERYSFVDDSWEEVGALEEARWGCAAGAAGGLLVAAGGWGGLENALASVELYDPREDKWRAGPALPETRDQAGAALI